MQVDSLYPVRGDQASLAQIERLLLCEQHVKVGLRRLRRRINPEFVFHVHFHVTCDDVLSDALLLAKLECALHLCIDARGVLLEGEFQTRAVSGRLIVLLPAHL